MKTTGVPARELRFSLNPRVFSTFNRKVENLASIRTYRSSKVPSYFQWVARASKMGKRLGGFLPRTRLIPEIDRDCSGGREKGQGCVKERLKVEKPNKT